MKIIVVNKNINPNIKKLLISKKNEIFSADEYVNGIVNGNRNMLSKAITLLESNLNDDLKKADQIIKMCLPFSGKSRRIGITGVPGVGKSTFIDYFGLKLIENNHKIAVLAIDPSSSLSGGSILGDKTRMESISGKIEAFVRPSPTSGTLGGVASKTRETIVLCEAAGFDTIIIETVGVGQSEIAVSSMVDLFLMLFVAGTGDELQGIKRGIMEMTDILVFTKNDGANIDRTKVAKIQFETALKFFSTKESNWLPKVCCVSAFEKSGFNELNVIIEQYFNHITKNGFIVQNRKNQSLQWLNDQIIDNLKKDFYQNETIKKSITKITQQIVNQQISPIYAAKELIKKYLQQTRDFNK
ncbi:MAG: methylmalonyl Co-A mutase-associated GTPase MeaB [Bacteroidales bacterium]|nr:methylmalonyl Co-A mutase-associated GTPase MeaB [Bacteroidales bacterium]